jgi:hypothetical protein
MKRASLFFVALRAIFKLLPGLQIHFNVMACQEELLQTPSWKISGEWLMLESISLKKFELVLLEPVGGV